MNKKEGDRLPILTDWKFLLKRVERTTERYKNLTEMCETVLDSMWLMDDKIFEELQEKGEEVLPYSHFFVWAYFRRNIVYLYSSYILGSMGFSHPSISLQRTVYETILRSYLFIVDPKEGDLYYSKLQTDEEEKFLRKRKFYGHSYLSDKLFTPKTKDKHRTFYNKLCVSAHAEIRGLLKDFPDYIEKEIEDRLKTILNLAYGNMQMMAEAFLDLLDISLKGIIKEILKGIIELTKSKPLFEPDKDIYFSKLRLKKGNFMDVLS